MKTALILLVAATTAMAEEGKGGYSREFLESIERENDRFDAWQRHEESKKQQERHHREAMEQRERIAAEQREHLERIERAIPRYPVYTPRFEHHYGKSIFETRNP